MPLKKGGYNLSFYITAMNALDTKDYQAIEGLMHEDFIWMNGYEMKTLDEWLEGLREEFKKDFTFYERTCLFENEDICAYQHFVTDEKGSRLRVTNVMLLQQGKVWRATVNRVAVN